MTQRPFIDAHLHLWDRGYLPYPWLDNPAMVSIAANYSIEDYQKEVAVWNAIGCVHVEAGTTADHSQDETLWLESVSAKSGWPNAIIAHVPLDALNVEAQLEWQAARSTVRGIRHIVNWHPDPARQAYPTDLTENSDWRHGYARLGEFGLSYDFHGHPPQLGKLAKVARRHEKTPLIINHLGLPSLSDGLEQWREGLRQLAELPQSTVKISGAGFIARPFKASDFRDIILEVLDYFGPARCMIASNFPTDRLFASLDDTLAAYDIIFAGFSDDEQRELWGGTANRVYRMGLEL